MATTILKIDGTFEWAKVFTFNRDHASWNEDSDGEYKVNVIIDEANYKKLKEAGTGKKIEKDPDGRGWVFTPTRKHLAAQDWQGGPPKVGRPDGTAWDTDTDGLIGNGSTGRVMVAVYDTNTGRKGTRLEALQVIDHVAYETEGSGDGGGGALRSFFKDFTKDGGKPAPKSKAKTVELEDDELPF